MTLKKTPVEPVPQEPRAFATNAIMSEARPAPRPHATPRADNQRTLNSATNGSMSPNVTALSASMSAWLMSQFGYSAT